MMSNNSPSLFPLYLLLLFFISLSHFFPPLLAFILAPEQREQQQRAFSPHLLFPHFDHGPQPRRPSNPILIIPGDGGNRLRANLTGKPSTVHIFCDKITREYFDLWLNLELIGPLIIDCWTDNMRLEWNASTGMAQDLAGVRVRIPGFGHTHSIEWLDSSKRSPGQYFSTIVDQLVSWGYRRGKDVVGAPFDWRRGPRELTRYFGKLRSLLESLYYRNGNRKVVVLAHSLGNCMANHFYRNVVDQAWKDKFVAAHVSLAAPWAGAAQIVKLFASGYNMDYWRILFPPSRLRQMQRSFSSSAFLFPSPRLWAPNETLAITPAKSYSHANLAEFFDDIGYPQGMDQWRSERDFMELGPPGVQVLCIYGVEQPTPEQFIWYHNWLFPNYQPYIKYGNGDGTVNLRSLEVCRQWDTAENGGKPVAVRPLNGADHMTILRDVRMLGELKTMLYGEDAGRGERRQEQSREKRKGIMKRRNND